MLFKQKGLYEVTTRTISYTSSKLEARPFPQKGGMSMWAIAPIAQGEVVAVWGGEIVTGAELEQFSHERQIHTVQVEDDIYLSPHVLGQLSDYINHSCTPNLGLSGQLVLVAMRDIAVNEEVCFDYAMCDATPYDEFECSCGTPECRRRITGNDWQRPELWTRYAGYFMPYIQRKIDELKRTLSVGAVSGLPPNARTN